MTCLHSGSLSHKTSSLLFTQLTLISQAESRAPLGSQRKIFGDPPKLHRRTTLAHCIFPGATAHISWMRCSPTVQSTGSPPRADTSAAPLRTVGEAANEHTPAVTARIANCEAKENERVIGSLLNASSHESSGWPGGGWPTRVTDIRIGVRHSAIIVLGDKFTPPPPPPTNTADFYASHCTPMSCRNLVLFLSALLDT